jgi:hypothetical protein
MWLLNGDLVSAAVASGFTCLLTRDQRFGESAARALKVFPNFSVVVVTLPQLSREKHLAQFLVAWHMNRIEPIVGALTRGPHH